MEQKLEQLLMEHLNQVWNQRDEALRIKAIKSIYAKDVIMFDMDEILKGHDAVNRKVAILLSNFSPDSSINQLKPNVFNNNVGKLEWGVGRNGVPIVMTGTDIVHFEDDKVKYFYVFVNK